MKKKRVAILNKNNNNDVASKFNNIGYKVDIFDDDVNIIKDIDLFDLILIHTDSDLKEAAKLKIRLYEQDMSKTVIIINGTCYPGLTIDEEKLLNSDDILLEIDNISKKTSPFVQMALCQMAKS